MTRYDKPADLPQELAVFPLTGALLLPRTELPLNIFEPRYLAMMQDAMSTHRIIGMIQPKAGDTSDKPELRDIGCAGRITSFTETPDGRLLVTLTGIARFKVISECVSDHPYRLVKADYAPFGIDFVSGHGADKVNRMAVLKAFRDYLESNNMSTNWDEVESVDTEQLVNVLSLMAPYPAQEKQALLEAADLKTRADTLIALTELALARQARPGRTTLQ